MLGRESRGWLLNRGKGKTEKEVDGLCERRHENCRGGEKRMRRKEPDGGARSARATPEMELSL